MSITAKFFGIIAAIVVTIYIAAFYIPQTIPELTTFRNFTAWAAPIACLPATALFLKAKWADYKKRGEDYWIDFFYIIIFFVWLVWALAFPGWLYDSLYMLISSGAKVPYKAIMSFAFLSAIIRSYVIEDWKKVLLLIGTGASMFVTTPIGDLVPFLRPIGRWIITVPAAAGIQVLFFFGYIATALTVVRIYILKERFTGM